MSELIHPTAIVDHAAQIHESVVVGPYSVIGADVTIDEKTIVESHVVIKGPSTIGKNNHFYSFSSIGEAPQDKKFANEKTELIIGDNNTIREFVSINRGTAQDAVATRIGNDNWIMAYVHIAHDCQIGSHTIMSNNATLAGHVHVEDHVILSGFAKVHQFCRIGQHSFCGMNTDITRDVPPYIMLSGNPGTPRGINQEGLKRRGFTPEQIRMIKEAYRLLYRKELKLDEAKVAIIELANQHTELQAFVNFFEKSERSIVR